MKAQELIATFGMDTIKECMYSDLKEKIHLDYIIISDLEFVTLYMILHKKKSETEFESILSIEQALEWEEQNEKRQILEKS